MMLSSGSAFKKYSETRNPSAAPVFHRIPAHLSRRIAPGTGAAPSQGRPGNRAVTAANEPEQQQGQPGSPAGLRHPQARIRQNCTGVQVMLGRRERRVDSNFVTLGLCNKHTKDDFRVSLSQTLFSLSFHRCICTSYIHAMIRTHLTFESDLSSQCLGTFPQPQDPTWRVSPGRSASQRGASQRGASQLRLSTSPAPSVKDSWQLKGNRPRRPHGESYSQRHGKLTF